MADRAQSLENELVLLFGTIMDLEESLKRLEEQRDKLNIDIRHKQERLRTWKSRLETVKTELEDPFGEKPKPRRRKGENLRAVKDLLATDVVRGFSISEVAEKIGIAWSSAHRTLETNSIFVQRDGLWFLKESIKNGNGDEKESQA
jgi:predicted  nucleic acid-binding Zn-ribbon protein